jgi:Delta14-sterol reductase
MSVNGGHCRVMRRHHHRAFSKRCPLCDAAAMLLRCCCDAVVLLWLMQGPYSNHLSPTRNFVPQTVVRYSYLTDSTFIMSKSRFVYEFGGPPGALCTVLALPFLIVWLIHWANVGFVDTSVINTRRLSNLPRLLISEQALLQEASWWKDHHKESSINKDWLVWGLQTCLWWFVGLVVLERLLPCNVVAGVQLPYGPRNKTSGSPRSLKANYSPKSTSSKASNGASPKSTTSKATDGASPKVATNVTSNGTSPKSTSSKANDDTSPRCNSSKSNNGSTSPSSATSTAASKFTFDNLPTRLFYRINGHLTFWLIVLWLQVGWPTWEIHGHDRGNWQASKVPLSSLYHHGKELAIGAIVWCWLLSIYLYIKSNVGNPLLSKGGNSGNMVYDFFMGRELNPRIGDFDWKVFCELRPGLIGWFVLNLAFCKEQRAELGYNTWSMYLIVLFQGMYVWDALFQEECILTTMDVTTDGFGYMLVLGDLAWVPFTYSLQARYLVKHDPHLSVPALMAIVGLYLLGYWIFRSSNSEKDAFRRNPKDPAVRHLSYMPTQRGTLLLTSGWWGMARKINYTGDYIMGLAWCMLCGFGSIVPYFYAVYFAILLVHRSIRDDHMCQEKYGDDWEEYKRRVPYRFIPHIV